MTNKQKALARLKELGATWDEGDLVDAPAGFKFAGWDLHTFVLLYRHPTEPAEGQVDRWADLLDRLELGVTPCTDTYCETCGKT